MVAIAVSAPARRLPAGSLSAGSALLNPLAMQAKHVIPTLTLPLSGGGKRRRQYLFLPLKGGGIRWGSFIDFDSSSGNDIEIGAFAGFVA
jgi:hypothetical protein